MTLYRCFATGVKSRKLFPADETFLSHVMEMIEKKPENDFYESIYLYNEDHLKIFKETHSLAGLKESIKTDRIVFDFDSKKDVQSAITDANELISRLVQIEIPTNAIRVFYSGSKGVHVEVHLNELLTRKEFENIIQHYAGDLETFDHKIKDEQRLFRFPLTRHNSTKRFKIPLTVDQLAELPLETIEKMSLMTDHDEYFELLNSYIPVDLPKVMREIKDLNPEEKKEYDNQIIQQDTPDMSRKPRHLTSAKYALQEGFFDEGERNEACMILASTYRFLGYNKELAYNMLKATLRMRSQRLGLPEYDKEELWNTVMSIVYSDSWKGGVYSEKQNQLLAKTVERYSLKDEYQEKSIVLVDEVSDRFLQFAKNIDKNTIKTGVEEIDNNVLITTGMMVGYLGAPSSGKTSDVISFLEHQSKNNIGAFFVSADMPDNLLYARLIQRYCGWDARKILETVKSTHINQWPKILKDAWDQVLVNFRNVGFSFQSGPTIEDIRNKIEEHEQLTGNKVRVVAIDYLEKVRCAINDATAASGYNASRIADMTRDKDMATILLLQPQKSAGDPSDALLSMRKVKGASVIEQDCRVIMTKWRPGFNPDSDGPNPDDKYSSIAVVKNNMGSTLRMNFSWDGSRGTMRSLTDDEKHDFKRVEEEAFRRKTEAKSSDEDYMYAQKTTSKPSVKRENYGTYKYGNGGDLY